MPKGCRRSREDELRRDPPVDPARRSRGRRGARYRDAARTPACRKPEPQPDQPLAAPAAGRGRPVLRAAVGRSRARNAEGAERRERGLLLDLLQPGGPDPGRVPDRLPAGRLRRSEQSDEEVLHLQPPAAAAVGRTRTTASSTSTTATYPANDPGLGIPVQRRHRARRHGLRSDAARRDCAGGSRLRRRLLPRQGDEDGRLHVRLRPAGLRGRRAAATAAAVAPSFSGSQQPQFERDNPEGVFSILPIEGTIVWNSHAFNVYDHADHQPAVAEPLVHGRPAVPRPAASSTPTTSSSRTCSRSRRSSTAARCCSARARASPT